MREILFRGKHLDNGEWVEGIPIKTHIGVFMVYEENPHFCSQYGYMEIDGLCPVDPETVGQYTGLTDKSGKKIFEGDIVKTKEFGRDSGKGVNFNNYDVFEVIYSSAAFRLNNSRRLFYLLAAQKYEVIGNIHDDPELLSNTAR